MTYGLCLPAHRDVGVRGLLGMTDVLIAIIGGMCRPACLRACSGSAAGVLFVPTLVLGLGLTQVHAGATVAARDPADRSRRHLAAAPASGLRRPASRGNSIGVASIVGVQGGVLAAQVAAEEAVIRRLFGAFLDRVGRADRLAGAALAVNQRDAA